MSVELTPDTLEQTIALAMTKVSELDNLLEEEFESLKVQDLDRFEILLNAKNDLLSDLTLISGVHQPEGALDLGPEWDEFKKQMLACRDKHRRNEILIMRKLDAIRGAIESLHIVDPTSSLEVYDRLGKINRMKRLRGFSEA